MKVTFEQQKIKDIDFEVYDVIYAIKQYSQYEFSRKKSHERR